MSVHPNQLVHFSGGECLERYGTLVKSPVLPVRQVQPTFTRSHASSAVSGLYPGATDGTLRAAEADAVRVAMLESAGYSGRKLAVLIEDQRTNLVDDQDLTTWTKVNSPPITSVTGPDGTSSAYEVEDDNGSNEEYIRKTVSFTGDGKKAVSVWIKEGTGSRGQIRLRDADAPANLLWTGGISWSDGEPTPSMADGTLLDKREGPDGWWRLVMQSDAVTAANTHHFQIYPTNAGQGSLTGSILAAFPQAEDALFPSTDIPTSGSTATRNDDDFRAPWRIPPQEMTLYFRFVEWSDMSTNNERIFHIGSTSAGEDPRMTIFVSGGFYSLAHDNGTTASTSTVATAPDFGDEVELRAVLNGDGSVQLHQSINGGAEESASQGSAAALGSAWAGDLFLLGSVAGLLGGFVGFRAAKAALGTHGMSAMRAAY